MKLYCATYYLYKDKLDKFYPNVVIEMIPWFLTTERNWLDRVLETSNGWIETIFEAEDDDKAYSKAVFIFTEHLTFHRYPNKKPIE